MYRYMQGVYRIIHGGGVEEVKTDKQNKQVTLLGHAVPLGNPPPPDPRLCQPIAGIFLSGALPPLNFDNPKRSKIWYVTCGTIIHRVVAVDKCKTSVIEFWIFVSTYRSTERSTIVDLLIKIPGPLNRAAYWKVHNFFKRFKYPCILIGRVWKPS